MVNLLSGARDAERSAPPLTDADLRRLAARLESVRRWVTSRSESGPIASRLRSAGLAPDLEEDVTPAALEASLHELALAREAELASRMSPGGSLAVGRLLVCEIEMSIGDGRSEAASQGFFDADDRPPWDLWLTCHGRSRRDQPDAPLTCLLAFVPEDLVPYAQAGIDANRSRSLYWPADTNGPLSAQLDELSGPAD